MRNRENPWKQKRRGPVPEGAVILTRLNLRPHLRKPLTDHGFRTADEVAELSRFELMSLRGISVRGVKELEVMLAEFRTSLRPGPTPEKFG